MSRQITYLSDEIVWQDLHRMHRNLGKERFIVLYIDVCAMWSKE